MVKVRHIQVYCLQFLRLYLNFFNEACHSLFMQFICWRAVLLEPKIVFLTRLDTIVPVETADAAMTYF